MDRIRERGADGMDGTAMTEDFDLSYVGSLRIGGNRRTGLARNLAPAEITAARRQTESKPGRS